MQYLAAENLRIFYGKNAGMRNIRAGKYEFFVIKGETMDRRLSKILQELKEKISAKYPLGEMRLFGSKARNDSRGGSDIDVFVRLSRANREIEEDLFDTAYELELKYDCLIDLIVFDNKMLENKHAVPPIYESILRESIVI